MSRVQRRVRLLALFVLIAPIGCGGDSGTSPSGSSSSSTPTILSCNAVSYRGTTYSNLGCAPGIASFTSTTSINGGAPVCFNITCSAGCVSSARIC